MTRLVAPLVEVSIEIKWTHVVRGRTDRIVCKRFTMGFLTRVTAVSNSINADETRY